MLPAGQGTNSGAGLYRMLAQEVAQAMKEEGKIWGLLLSIWPVIPVNPGSTGVWLRQEGSFRVPNQPELHSQPTPQGGSLYVLHPLTGFLLPLLILVARELELSGEEFNSSSNY